MASLIKLEPNNGLTLQNLTDDSQSSVSSSYFSDQDTDHAMRPLERLCQEISVDKLENGLKIGIDFLKELRPAVSRLNSPAGSHHLKTIEGLLRAQERTRTIVGVVGNTGAGKSSVLNAVLDESELLPTNCMRACTASVTELSFNHSNDPSEKYRAEVEFISPQDWSTELELLWTDLIDSQGKICREATAKEGDASIAFAKVKAVYPTYGNAALSACDPKELAREPSVLELLGTTKRVQAETATELFSQLQVYVDSKDARDGRTTDKTMEAWPLVKVVRIFTKAAALATGVVLVDLPGIHDSNAARAAVATNYMKECSGLWILAPISRAVDDKSAKTLLGNAFKQQLKFDGLLGQVTFICSKTDDISVAEAVKSLDIEEVVQNEWDLIDEIQERNRSAKKEIKKLEAKGVSLGHEKKLKKLELVAWSQLSVDIRRGFTVYPPPPPVVASKKRKHRTRQTRNRKDCSSDDSEDSSESEYELVDEPTDSEPATTSPLTSMEINQHIASLKKAIAELKQNKTEAGQRVKMLMQEMKCLKRQEIDLQHKVAAMCVKGRNDYSRKAIQYDFATGIKELDEEALNDKDESSFNPEVDFRDYDQVADSLPVFCVSSRAYQHMRGHNKRDKFNGQGFNFEEDTEIPQLMKHAQGMSEATRVGQCRRFLNNLLQLIDSMSLWTRPREASMKMTAEEHRLSHEALHREFEVFETAFATAIDTSVTTLQDHFNFVISALDAKIPAASSTAVDICRSWGAPKSEGGLLWATYKATLNRNGCFDGAAGPRDFNRELLKPIMAPLASAWEEAFQRRIPVAIQTLATSVETSLRVLHNQVANANNLPYYTEHFAVLGNQLLRTGCFMRMKDVMAGHVEAVRHNMFEQAKKTVQVRLEALSNKVNGHLKTLASEISATILHDYSAVLLGNMDEPQEDRAEHLSGIAEILSSVDKRFTPGFEAALAPVMVKEEITDVTRQPSADQTIPEIETESSDED